MADVTTETTTDTVPTVTSAEGVGASGTVPFGIGVFQR